MLITDISRQECFDLITRMSIGRLACVIEGQPYVVPLRFAPHDGMLFCLTTLGKKVDAMRANARVCVEFEEIADIRTWTTVLVFGHFRELTAAADRQQAFRLLEGGGNWWEPAYAKAVIAETPRPLEPLYFSVHVDEISGRRSRPD